MVRRSSPARRSGIPGNQQGLCDRKDQHSIQEIKKQRAHGRAENEKQAIQFSQSQSRTFHRRFQTVQVSVGSIAV